MKPIMISFNNPSHLYYKYQYNSYIQKKNASKLVRAPELLKSTPTKKLSSSNLDIHLNA